MILFLVIFVLARFCVDTPSATLVGRSGWLCWSQPLITAPGTYWRAKISTYHFFAGIKSTDQGITCFYATQEGARAEIQSECARITDSNNGCNWSTLAFESFTIPPPHTVQPPPTPSPRPCPWHRAISPPAQGGCYQRTDNCVDTDCSTRGKNDCLSSSQAGCAWVDPPPPPYALYIIQNDTLYCVNGQDASPQAKILGKPGNWPGFGAITYSNGKLFIAEQHLYSVDRHNGAFTHLSAGDWQNSTSMGFVGGTLFVIQAGALHSVNPNDGTYKVLGAIGDWNGHTSMAASPTDLHIIQDEKLWRVDPATGKFSRLGTAGWKAPAYLAAAGSKLLAVENSRFHVIDKATGQYTVKGGPDWPVTTAFAADEGMAFAIEQERLWRININDGSFVKLSDGWSGHSVMAAAKGVRC